PLFTSAPVLRGLSVKGEPEKLPLPAKDPYVIKVCAPLDSSAPLASETFTVPLAVSVPADMKAAVVSRLLKSNASDVGPLPPRVTFAAETSVDPAAAAFIARPALSATVRLPIAD